MSMPNRPAPGRPQAAPRPVAPQQPAAQAPVAPIVPAAPPAPPAAITQALAPVAAPAGAGAVMNRPDNLPAHIRMTGDQSSMKNLSQYIQPPRLRCVQQMSKGEIRERWNEGDVIIMPDMVEVEKNTLNQYGKPGDESSYFYSVPIFQYTEFVIWNPLAAFRAGALPAIRDRTFDQNSIISRTCRDPSKRNQVCKEFPVDSENKPQYIQFCEHINFVIILPYLEGFEQTPLVISYSRGDFKYGGLFSQLILSRRTDDIYANQFLCQSKRRTNAKGNWFGFNMVNPGPPPEGEADMRWVTDSQYRFYGELNSMLAMKYSAGEIQAQYGEFEELDVTGAEVHGSAAAAGQRF